MGEDSGEDVGVGKDFGENVGIGEDFDEIFGVAEDFDEIFGVGKFGEDIGMGEDSDESVGVASIGENVDGAVCSGGDVKDVCVGVGVGEVDEVGVVCFPSMAASIATSPPPLTIGTTTYLIHNLITVSSTGSSCLGDI